ESPPRRCDSFRRYEIPRSEAEPSRQALYLRGDPRRLQLDGSGAAPSRAHRQRRGRPRPGKILSGESRIAGYRARICSLCGQRRRAARSRISDLRRAVGVRTQAHTSRQSCGVGIQSSKSMEVFQMTRSITRKTIFLLACLCVFSFSAAAQDVPSDYQEVLKSLDRKGDFKAGVLKVNIPRNDLKMTIEGFSTPTPFGFGGWVALTKASDGSEVMMGDLVLLQEEVNPVLSALLDNGIDVTALHNHFFWDDPHVYFMHVHAMGKAADLAQRVKPGLDLIGHVKAESPASANSSGSPLDNTKLAKIVGHEGEQSGPVYKITIGRDDLAMKEHGATINARMGLNTWAAFTGTQEDAAIAGDVAMLESELTPVLKVLRKNGLDVVAIHHHMTGDRPMVIFLHYWGRGPAEKLAAGFKAALDELGKGAPAHGMGN